MILFTPTVMVYVVGWFFTISPNIYFVYIDLFGFGTSLFTFFLKKIMVIRSRAPHHRGMWMPYSNHFMRSSVHLSVFWLSVRMINRDMCIYWLNSMKFSQEVKCVTKTRAMMGWLGEYLIILPHSGWLIGFPAIPQVSYWSIWIKCWVTWCISRNSGQVRWWTDSAYCLLVVIIHNTFIINQTYVPYRQHHI